MVVKEQFKTVGIEPTSVLLGEVEMNVIPTENQLKQLNTQLSELGFEILDDRRKRQIEIVKKSLIEIIQTGEIEEHFSLMNFVSKKTHKEYSQISKLFSEVEGLTVEQFFILQKIEKVKEWLVYEELTLSEITWKLGYSSIAHLSAQFKKTTGMTPSEFKKLGSAHRKSLDEI
jgi:AraC-like DNA-binding protein